MLLAIDVGNTQSVLGLYQGDQLIGEWRVSTSPTELQMKWGP